MTQPHPPAHRHGELIKHFEDVFFVTGAVRMAGPLPVSFSRNMVVVRQGDSLILINSMRLDETGLVALDALGKVEHVIRLAGFHGIDDPFYRDRYGAKIWALAGSFYGKGFDSDPGKAYFEPDAWLGAGDALPIEGARLIRIESSKPAEGLVLLERDGGILVAGDCLQNWTKADAYFSFVGGVMMRAMGFIRPYNVGPGWLKSAKPDPDELRRLLELPFEHVLPAHGEPVIGDAKTKFRSALERLK